MNIRHLLKIVQKVLQKIILCLLMFVSVSSYAQEWISIGPKSREFHAVAWHPENQSIIFASNFYTVFKTEDRMETWQKVFSLNEQHFANMIINDIQFDPFDSEIIYLRISSIAWNTREFGGVFKSTDGGDTFQRVFTGVIAGFKIHPLTGKMLVYGNDQCPSTYDNTAYISEDQGETWTFYPNFPFGISQLAFDPVDDNVMYIANSTLDGILKTVDGGHSWQNIGFDGVSLLMCVTHPENSGELWVSSCNTFAPQFVYHSVDAGETWNLYDLPYNESGFVSHNVYHLVFGSDMNNMYMTDTNEVFYTTDGGQNWNSYVFYDEQEYLYPTFIVLNPSNDFEIILISDSGALFSNDGAVSWSDFEIVSGHTISLETIEEQNGAYYIYAGNYGGLKRYHSESEQWDDFTLSQWYGLTIYSMATDTEMPGLLITGNESQHFFGYLNKSTNYGETMTQVWNNFSYQSGSVSKVLKSPAESGVFYATTWSRYTPGELLRSEDWGDTWTVIDTDNQTHYSFSYVLVSHTNPNLIYSFGDGKVAKSIDRAETFEYKNQGLPDGWAPYYACINPYDDQNLFILLENGIYKTNDGGESWIMVSSVWAKRIDFHPLVPGLLFCITNTNELLVSYDEGITWSSYTNQTPANVLTHFTFSPDGSELIIGTHTDGIFKTTVNMDVIVPTNLYAESNGFTVSLSWDAIPGARKYGIYRNNIKVAEVENNFYDEYYLLPGQYTYNVTTIAGTYESEFSNNSIVNVYGSDICGPDNLITQKTDFRAVLLTWNAPEIALSSIENNEFHIDLQDYINRNLTGYKVYRNGNLIHTLNNAQTMQYSDSGLDFGTYSYAVTAVFSDGESMPSTPSVITLENPFFPPLNLRTQINENFEIVLLWDAPDFSDWEEITPDLVAYFVYRHEPYELESVVYDLENLVFVDTNIEFDTEYTYTVKALYANDEVSIHSNESKIIVANPYLAPVRLSAEFENLAVNLKWEMPQDIYVLSWDEGIFAGGFGVYGGGPIMAAICFAPEHLTEVDGKELKRIRFYPLEANSTTVKVLSGENGETLLYEQYVGNAIPMTWNEVVLEEPVIINANTGLWIAYEMSDTQPQTTPIGFSTGPAVDFFGGVYSLNGGEFWNWVSDGVNANVLIQGEVIDEFGRSVMVSNLSRNVEELDFHLAQRETDDIGFVYAFNQRSVVLSGFNIYRNGDFLSFYDDVMSRSYVDYDILQGNYTYTVSAVYQPVIESAHSNQAFVTVDITSEADELISSITALKGNYPNPFNPETRISFSLDKSQNVSIEIYNIKGQKVKTLVNGELPAKNHVIIWRGDDDFGKSVGSGVYFYKMKTGNYTETKKMLMLK